MAIHTKIINDVKEKLEAIGLYGDPQVRVVHRGKFEEGTFEANTIYLCRSSERPGAGTFGSDEIGFPVVVFMVRGTGGGSRENEEEFSDWRDSIQVAFDNRREPIENLSITGVTPLICRLDYEGDFLEEFFKSRWSVNHLAIWCFVRKLRS